MRDTRKSLLTTGGLAAVGAALIAFGAFMYEREGEGFSSTLPIGVGLAIAPIALAWFIGSIVSGLRKEMLEAGAGEIARWKLSPSEWAAFREQEKRFMAAGRPANMLDLGKGGNGEVIFAPRAVIANEDYHDLTPGGLIDLIGVEWVQGSPSCFEFHMVARRTGGASGANFGTDNLWLRVPIALDERRAAAQVFAHFTRITKRAPPIAFINPKLTIRICLGIAAACAISAIWGFANRETHTMGWAPMIAAVVGVVLGGGVLLLAALVAGKAGPAQR